MYKIFKKLIILPMFFMGIMLVLGAEDCEPIQNNVSSDDRTLTCDSEKAIVTSYEYPKGVGNQATALDNEYCKIVCKENIKFSFGSIRKVFSGMGFEYSINMSGKRSCQSTYKNVEDFDKLYREMIDSYLVLYGNKYDKNPRADANGDGFMDEEDVDFVKSKVNKLLTLKDMKGKQKTVLDLDQNGVVDFNAEQTLLNEISRMSDLKRSCNEWGTTEDSKYKLTPEARVLITTSKDRIEKKYEYVELQPYKPVVSENKSTYISCNLVNKSIFGLNVPSCSGETTKTGWTETVSILGKYTLPECYLELYTGKVINKGEKTTRPTCIAGNKFYVSFDEKTRPDPPDSKTDNGYPIFVELKGIGNNIEKSGPKNMNLKINCSYQVLNYSSPLKTDYVVESFPGRVIKSYSGFSLFDYRAISLKDPFPGRDPLSNWDGFVKFISGKKEVKIPLKEYYITSKGENVRNKNLYTINLNNSTVRDIRGQNKSVYYGTFDLDQSERSRFIENNFNIIKRGE